MAIEEGPQSPKRSVHSESKRDLSKVNAALGFAIAGILFGSRVVDSPTSAQDIQPDKSGHELSLSAEQLPPHLQGQPAPYATTAPGSVPVFEPKYLPNLSRPDVRGPRPVPLPEFTLTPTATSEIPSPTPPPTNTVEPTQTSIPEFLRGELTQGLQVHEAPGSQARHHRLSAPSPDSAYIGSYMRQNFSGVAAEFPHDYAYDLFRLSDGSNVSVRSGTVTWISAENRFATAEEVWVENKAYQGDSHFVTNKSEDIFASGIRYNQMPTRFEFAYEKIDEERQTQLGSPNEPEQYGVAVVAVEWVPGEKTTTEIFSITTSETGLTKINYGAHDQVLFEEGVAPGNLVADVNWDGTEINVSQRQTDGSLVLVKTVTLDNPIPNNKTFLVGRTVTPGIDMQTTYSAAEKPDGIYNPRETLSTSDTLEDLAAQKGMQMGVTVFSGVNYFSESRTIAEESHPQVDYFYLAKAIIDSPAADSRPKQNVIEYYQAHGFAPEYSFWLWWQQENTHGTREQLHAQLDNLLAEVDTSQPGRFTLAGSGFFFDFSHAYSNLYPGSTIVSEINSYVSSKAPNLEIWYRVPGSLLLVGPDRGPDYMKSFTQDIQALGENKPDGIQLMPTIGVRGTVPEDKLDEFADKNRVFLQNGIKMDWVNTTFVNRDGFDTSILAEELITEAYTLSQEYPGQFSLYNANFDRDAQSGGYEYAYQLNANDLAPERSETYWDMYRQLELLP